MVFATGMRVLAFQRISNGLQVGLGGVGIAPSKQAQWGWLCAGACAFISTTEAENAILLHYGFVCYEWDHQLRAETSCFVFL